MDDVSIVIPYRYLDAERQTLLEWVVERWRALLPSAPIVLGASPDGPFNRGAAINDGVARTDTQAVVIADGDVIVSRPGLNAALATGRWGFPFDVFYTLTPAWTAEALLRPPRAEFDELANEPQPMSIVHRHPGKIAAECVSGCIVVPRCDFDRVGGFDSMPSWGFEDRVFDGTMRRHIGQPFRSHANALHLAHTVPAAHDPNSPEVAANRDRYEQLKARGFPIVGAG